MVLTYDAYSETIEERERKESEVKQLQDKYEQGDIIQRSPEMSDRQLVRRIDVSHVLFEDLSDRKPEKRDVILHLISLGLAAERVVRRLEKLADDFSVNLKKLEKLSSSDQNVTALRKVLDILVHETSMLSTNSGMADKSETDTTEIIERVVRLHVEELADYSISLEKDLSGFQTVIPSTALLQIIDNIVVNGIYWLARKGEINDRKLGIFSNSKERSIYICNNGPSIQPQVKKTIFNSPFVTRRPRGHGLGMYICFEILKRYNCSVELEDENSAANRYHSTCFKILCR